MIWIMLPTCSMAANQGNYPTAVREPDRKGSVTRRAVDAWDSLMGASGRLDAMEGQSPTPRK